MEFSLAVKKQSLIANKVLIIWQHFTVEIRHEIKSGLIIWSSKSYNYLSSFTLCLVYPRKAEVVKAKMLK